MVDSLDNPQLPDLKDAVQMKSIKKENCKITANWADIDYQSGVQTRQGWKRWQTKLN